MSVIKKLCLISVLTLLILSAATGRRTKLRPRNIDESSANDESPFSPTEIIEQGETPSRSSCSHCYTVDVVPPIKCDPKQLKDTKGNCKDTYIK